MKFNEIAYEVFGYSYHNPSLAADYVRENGVYQFSADYSGKEITVKLETAMSYRDNGYGIPNADYEVSEVVFDGKVVDLDFIQDLDQDLYERVQDLCVNTHYNQDPEDYSYDLFGEWETNYGEELFNVSYENMKQKRKAGFSVVNCKLNS